MIERLYHYFIPVESRELLGEHYRARILVTEAFLGTLILTPFIFIRFIVQGAHLYPIVLTITVILIFISPWVMRRSGSVRMGGMFLTVTVLVGFIIMAAVDGGISSPSVFALPLIPLFAVFFGSLRTGFIITAVMAVLLIILTYFTVQGWVLPNSLPEVIQPYVDAATALSLTLILIAMAYLFMEWQRISRERLTIASTAKDEFLSGMSHELRTPLNSVMGFTEVLLHEYVGPLNEQQKEQLGYIYSGSEHLLELVEDLVNVTNLETGKLKLEPAEVNLRDIITFCTTSLGDRAEEKQITFTYDFGDAPEIIIADGTRLRQILLNIVSNALKFSPAGEKIHFSLHLNGPIVEIKTTDAGPGISEEHREKIFEKFYQVHSGLSGKTVGSGLGLYIARRLAELHGGRLQLTDLDQPGTSFVLILPVRSRDGTL